MRTFGSKTTTGISVHIVNNAVFTNCILLEYDIRIFVAVVTDVSF